MIRYLFVIILALIGKAKASKKADYKNKYEFVFGEEASKTLEHGVLVGTWSREGYGSKEISIGFKVNGHVIPPAFSMEFFEQLVAAAKSIGISTSHLMAYGGLMRARCDYNALAREVQAAKEKQEASVGASAFRPDTGIPVKQESENQGVYGASGLRPSTV